MLIFQADYTDSSVAPCSRQPPNHISGQEPTTILQFGCSWHCIGSITGADRRRRHSALVQDRSGLGYAVFIDQRL